MPRRRPSHATPDASIEPGSPLADLRELEALEAETGHRCPPWCHSCPILRLAMRRAGRVPTRGEDVMPRCWGSVMGSVCTCKERRPRRDSERIAALEAECADLRRKIDRAVLDQGDHR